MEMITHYYLKIIYAPILLGLMIAFFPYQVFCSEADFIHENKPNDGIQLLLHKPFIKDAQTAIDQAYNFEFEAAIQTLEPWKRAYPESPIWPFWEALPIWWEILKDLETEAYDEPFIKQMEKVDVQVDKQLRKDRTHADALVIKALTNGFLSRLYSNRESWYKSLTHARISMNILFNLERLYPEIADVQFGLGLYDYFAAHLTEEYSIVRAFSWMIPNGDKEMGLERLKRAADESVFLKPEATYFLGHIYLHYENEYTQALNNLTGLTAKFPENTFFQRLLIRTYVRNRRYEKAVLLIEELTEKYADSEQEYALLEEMYTVRGNIYFRMFDFSNAEKEYLNALSLENSFPNAHKRHRMTEARYRLAQIYLQSNRTVEAQNQFQIIVRNRPDSKYFDQARDALKKLKKNG